MFSLIRGVIIVGLIVYFSPVRDRGEPEHPGAGEKSIPVSTAPAPGPEPSEHQDRLLGRLVGNLTEDVVRTAVNDRTQAGLRLKEQLASHLLQPSTKSATASMARSSERETAGRSNPGQPVRCIYRCDGTE